MSSQHRNNSDIVVSPMRSGRFILMFIVLCILFSLGQFHRSSGSVLAPVFVEELMLNAEQVGLVIGGMFIFQGLMQVPSGILIDRYGTRIVLPAMVLIAVAGSLILGYAESWIGIFVGRAMLGIGFATSLLGAYTVFVRWGTPEMISTITGRFLFVGCIGALFSTLPLAWVLELFDWRSVFLTLAVATLVSAVLTYIVVRDVPFDAAPLKPAGPPETLRSSIAGLGMVLRDRRIWPILSIAIFLYSPMQMLIGIWAGPFLKDVHQVDSIHRSYVLLAMAIAMSFGMLMYGPIERFFNTRRSVVLMATGAIAVMFFLLATVGYASFWMSSILFVMITLAAPFFLVVLAHGQLHFAPEYASRAVSLISLLAITGVFIMQFVTGQVIGSVTDSTEVTGSVLGYRLMFALMAGIFLLMLLVYRRTRDIPPKG